MFRISTATADTSDDIVYVLGVMYPQPVCFLGRGHTFAEVILCEKDPQAEGSEGRKM
jgi:hypothetical protein